MTISTRNTPVPANWAAVWATSLGVAALTAAEMLPVSLLSPIATDLGITEGMAGQAITATAIIALLASLFIAVVAAGTNRRRLLLGLSAAQIASNLIVALAPSFPVLLVGRMLLGLSLGGFWALSAALAMRLVPPDDVPKAFSIIFGGVSIATVAAAPIGSYLGGFIGWRGVFMVSALLATVAFVWQFASLPSMPANQRARLSTLFHVLTRPSVGLGMTGVVLVFAGHFAFFTYLRPFLESVTHVGLNGVSAILLAFGVGSLIGTWASARMLKGSLKMTLALIPLFMALLTLTAILSGQSALATTAVVAAWGFCFGTIPVGWSTWLTQSVQDEAEAGGGLLVAAIQIAMTVGAAAGGFILDGSGVVTVFGTSGVILLIAAVLLLTRLRVGASA